MSNSVKFRSVATGTVASPRSSRQATGLYSRQGTRKYLTRAERQRVLEVIGRQGTDAGLLAMTIAWTGARVSEVLALTPQSFQVDAGLVAIVTLKRRRLSVREVPLPPGLMAALDLRFALTTRSAEDVMLRLWPYCRATAWRQMKEMMKEAGIAGRAACPRGLRHAFGVGTLQAGVPMSLLQRWMGHARLTTTAIYAEVSGAEERAFAASYWEWSGRTAA